MVCSRVFDVYIVVSYRRVLAAVGMTRWRLTGNKAILRVSVAACRLEASVVLWCGSDWDDTRDCNTLEAQ